MQICEISTNDWPIFKVSTIHFMKLLHGDKLKNLVPFDAFYGLFAPFFTFSHLSLPSFLAPLSALYCLLTPFESELINFPNLDQKVITIWLW